jgi:hypothetical protein
MVLFDLVAFPLEDAILELDVACLEVLVVLVYPLVLLLLVPEEVVDSLHARLGVHVGNHGHYQQPHRGGDKVENGQNCVNLRRSETLLSVDCRVDTENGDRGEDGEHIHEYLHVGPVDERLEVELDLLSSDIIDLLRDERFPPIILDYSYPRKILIHSLCPFISPH